MAYNVFLPRLQFRSSGSSVTTAKMHFSSQFAHTWLVREPLVLAVSQLVQIGTAGKVDHGGWSAHQHLTRHSQLGDSCLILSVRSDNCQLRHLSARTTVRPDDCQVDNCQNKLSDLFR